MAKRYQGRIADWKDDKGFGFVSPVGGGDRVFVHISTIVGSRRPATGSLVTYGIEADAQGRIRATNVQFTDNAGLTPAVKAAGRRRWRLPILPTLFFLGLGWALNRFLIPSWIVLAYALMSVITFIAYAFDKGAAQDRGQRTPEATLHLLDLVGGWPGGRIAQLWLRHKSAKAEFLAAFWFTVACNLAALGYYLHRIHGLFS